MVALLALPRGPVRLACVVVAMLVAAGCSNPFSKQVFDGFSITYKINIQQGIVVTQEMADQLRVGMTRDQVRFVLGTPILTDPFHAERWDYPFRFQPGRGPVEERRFTVFFAKDQLTGYNGDSLPTEEEFARSRNFATTKIVRGPAPLSSAPPLPGATSDVPSGTTVTPGRNVTPDRPTTPTDQTPTPPSPSN